MMAPPKKNQIGAPSIDPEEGGVTLCDEDNGVVDELRLKDIRQILFETEGDWGL